jgi:hypothetical protein
MAKKKSVYGPGDKTQAPKAAATNKSFFGNPKYLKEKIIEVAEGLIGGSQGTFTGKMPTSGAAGKAAALTEAQKKQAVGVPQGMKLKKGGKVSKKKTKKPRGVGVAQRGYGKALTGKKK